MKKQVFIYILSLFIIGMKNERLNAQTLFNPNTYSGWVSTPTNSFATIPAASGASFTQITRGAGNTFSTASDGFNSSKWNNASASDAITANRYLTFSISSDAATSMEVDSLLLILGRSNAGPDSCILQYKSASTGNLFVPVVSGVHVILSPSTSPTTALSIVPLSPIQVSPNDSVVFRLVAWDATSTLGTMKLMNNTTLYGKTTQVVSNSIDAAIIQTTNAVCVSPAYGDSVQVSFNSIGAFNPGNTYSLELSDASGNFSTPLVIGNITSSLNNGTIQGVIPAGTTSSNYRLRISSSDPVINGLDTTQLMIHPGMDLSASVIQPSCPDSTGAISLAVTGGSGVIEYDWSNGGSTPNLTNLAAGIYTVTISDAPGCLKDSTFSIQTVPNFLITETITDATCHSGSTGSIQLSVAGGTAPYSVSWSGNGINQTGMTANNLPAGTYLMDVLDANNCPYTNSYVVEEPDALAVTDSLSEISCHSGSNGSIHLSVSGGSAPYSVLWSGNGINQTGLTASGLEAGNYNLSITDGNNCVYTDTYVLTEPDLLTISASITNATCASCNGNISLTVSGGTSPYSYEWADNSVLSQITGIPGTYCVEVSDAAGCTTDSCLVISSTAGIETTDQLVLNVFPNPASEFVQMEFSAHLKGVSKHLSVLDVSGKVIYTASLSGEISQLLIPVTNWSNGTYTYLISLENEIPRSGRIIVSH